MWKQFTKAILKLQIPLVLLLIITTGMMAFFAKDIELSYEFQKIIPKDHPKYIEYEQFIDQYGEDGNILMLGVQTERMGELSFFKEWYNLGKTLEEQTGVKHIISLAHAFNIEKDTSEKKFLLQPIVNQLPTNKASFEALNDKMYALPFYENLLYNKETQAYLMAVVIDDTKMDSQERNDIVLNLLQHTEAFTKSTNTPLHYSGLPYLRVYRTTTITKELQLFTILSIVLAISIILLLYRSFPILILPIIVFLTSLIWTVGIVVVLGYKLTLLTGLIPSIIVVISVPNCVYMINRYRIELSKGLEKKEAIESMFHQVGFNIFFANLTTAIGFSVFAFMESQILKEFGIVAGLSLVVLFVSSIILIPFILRLLPARFFYSDTDTTRKKGLIDQLLVAISQLVSQRRKAILGGSLLLALLTTTGIYQVRSAGYIFDDVSSSSTVYKDLRFFESHFKGVLPFDILIDTGKKKGITKKSTLKRLDKLQADLAADSLLSRPLLITEGLKFVTQGFYGGDQAAYKLPSQSEQGFIYPYINNTNLNGQSSNQVFSAFADTTQQIARISMQMADVGSANFPLLLASVQKKVEKYFKPDKYPTTYTGTSLIAIEGYHYLVKGLLNSVAIAFFLITLIVFVLFLEKKMLLIALIPNILPLMVTGAVMGYSGITLKPATVLIFSIAFGISVDFTIHFLTKFRLERQLQQGNELLAVQHTIQETGLSMVYTALILLFGFIIFTFSSFTGTFYLGLLTSITILVALLANLVLLPALLLLGNEE